jgi:hypothetical protein
VSKSGGERAAVQTLRAVRESRVNAAAFGLRWLQPRSFGGGGFLTRMARIFAGSIRVDWRDSRLNFLSEECWTETGWQNKVASVKREDKFGNNKCDHAVEKLTDTLKCLATHPGDARERIVAAYCSFGHLRAEEFPEECRKDWNWIKEEITKFGPFTDSRGKVWRSSVENTMKTVRKATASKVAKKLYELYWVVSANRQYA